jgi:hypothetical protein
MSGKKGKSGGLRDGAGRPRSKITIRLGDQFYVPMRGLAEVTAIGYGEFTVSIGGDVVKFKARSRKRPAPTP